MYFLYHICISFIRYVFCDYFLLVFGLYSYSLDSSLYMDYCVLNILIMINDNKNEKFHKVSPAFGPLQISF